MRRTAALATLLCLLAGMPGTARSQELMAKVNVNRQKVSDTKGDVFPVLEKKVTSLLNNTPWTTLKLKESERIQCTFNITVNTYSDTDDSFSASLLVTSSRPVYGSGYTTTAFSNNDTQFSFKFNEFDELEYRPEQVDNQLVALLAYYAYMIIAADLDTMSPLGGTEVLQKAEEVVNAGQTMDYPGWKAFDSSKNRFAIINDYLDGALEPLRTLQYDYYRKGLDEMANNVERGRTEITTAITENLKKAHENRPSSLLPQIWTDYKKDEIANIYKGKGTAKEKENVYNVLFGINPSQNNAWTKIKE